LVEEVSYARLQQLMENSWEKPDDWPTNYRRLSEAVDQHAREIDHKKLEHK
jgi:hypothetical protein